MNHFQLKWILAASIFILPLFVIGQDAGTIIPDSTQTEIIDLDDLDERSFETSLDLTQLRSELIKDSDLELMRHENDSLISLIGTFLDSTNAKTLEFQSRRQLDNNLIFWNQQLSLINDGTENITSVMRELDNNKNKLHDETRTWKNTLASDEEVEKQDADRINDILFSIDTTLQVVKSKDKLTVQMLKKTLKCLFLCPIYFCQYNQR